MSLGERRFLSRAAALAILLALIGAFCLGPAAAYLGWIDGNAERLQRDQAVLQHERAVIRIASAPLTARADQSLLFPAPGPAQAAAGLQETLKRRAAAARVEIEGIQVLPEAKLAGVRRIGVRLRGSAGIGGLARLLYAIAQARPLLYPDNLRIRLTPAAPDRSAGARLNFQLDVSGFTSG